MADQDTQDLDMEQLMAPKDPSTFSKVLTSPWLQLGLPLLAGAGTSIRQGIGPGARAFAQTAQGLSGIGLQQQKMEAQDEQRTQRRSLMQQFMKTPEYQSMNPNQRVSAINNILGGKGVPEEKLYNLRPGGSLVTGAGQTRASAPAAEKPDSIQLVQGADGQYYRVNKQTGEKFPVEGLTGKQGNPSEQIQLVQDSKGQYFRINKQTGEKTPVEGLIGPQSPETKVNIYSQEQNIRDAAQAAKRIKPTELVLDVDGKVRKDIKTYGEADKAGTAVYGVQESNVWKANTTLLTHAELTRKAVEKALPRITAGNPNRLKAFLSMKLDEFQNQPEVVNLFSGLGPMTAIAAAGSLGGGGTRGGVRLAVMLAPAGVQEGDTVGIMLGKLRNWVDVAQGKVEAVGLPTKPFENERTAIDKMSQSLQPKQVKVSGKTLTYVP